jgi:hypothetical protein
MFKRDSEEQKRLSYTQKMKIRALRTEWLFI